MSCPVDVQRTDGRTDRQTDRHTWTDIRNPESNIVGAHNTNKLKHSILQYKASCPQKLVASLQKVFRRGKENPEAAAEAEGKLLKRRAALS